MMTTAHRSPALTNPLMRCREATGKPLLYLDAAILHGIAGEGMGPPQVLSRRLSNHYRVAFSQVHISDVATAAPDTKRRYFQTILDWPDALWIRPPEQIAAAEVGLYLLEIGGLRVSPPSLFFKPRYELDELMAANSSDAIPVIRQQLVQAESWAKDNQPVAMSRRELKRRMHDVRNGKGPTEGEIVEQLAEALATVELGPFEGLPLGLSDVFGLPFGNVNEVLQAIRRLKADAEDAEARLIIRKFYRAAVSSLTEGELGAAILGGVDDYVAFIAHVPPALRGVVQTHGQGAVFESWVRIPERAPSLRLMTKVRALRAGDRQAVPLESDLCDLSHTASVPYVDEFFADRATCDRVESAASKLGIGSVVGNVRRNGEFPQFLLSCGS